MKSVRVRVLAAPAVAVLLLMASACSSSNNSSSTTAVTSTSLDLSTTSSEVPLTTPLAEVTTLAATTTTTTSETLDAVILANPKLTKFAAALKAAGLLGSLKSGNGPFTIFAPTDNAFAKLKPATMTTLLKAANKTKLTRLLRSHIVKGTVLIEELKNGSLSTINGKVIKVVVAGGHITLTDAQGNTSRVVQTDIVAANGVVHLVTAVFLPAGS
jgi:uncharacterized surface protein with fasciclin (FAS1) repeats